MARFLTYARIFTFSVAVSAIAQAALAGDVAKGKMVFAQNCSICHSVAKDGAGMLGPTLFDVVGRQAASVKGYDYSSAMKGVNYAWTPAHLKTYLESPRSAVAGNKMTFNGVVDPAKRDDLIAYLSTLK